MPPSPKNQEDSDLFQQNLDLAQVYLGKGQIDEALKAYTNAFQYTKDLTAYEIIPLLYIQKNNYIYAALAYLYLAQAQLQQNPTSLPKILQEMFTDCQASLQELVPFQELEAVYFLNTNQKEKAFPLLLSLAEQQKQTEKKQEFLEQALSCCSPAQTKQAETLFRKLLSLSPS